MIDGPRLSRILLRAATLAFAVVLGACARREAAPDRSVLLLSLDTLRADHLGVYGDPKGTSPHLDRFARGGALFAECASQATSTLPSHRSMFRSRVASRSTQDTPMLAETMQGAGLATIAFTGGGNLSKALGFDRGFDRWEEDRGGLAWSNSEVERWLDETKPRRFFAFVHTYDVHMPYDPPRELAEYFDPGYRGTVTGPATRDIARALRGLDPMPGGPPKLDDADRNRFIALYDGAIRRADDLFGDLLFALETRGLLDRTSVIVMADHGEEFWDHGSVLHSHTVHRELAHVPLLVRDPRAAAGTIDAGVVRLMDVAPTIAELAGVLPAPSFDGESLAPRLEGRDLGVNRGATTERAKERALLEFPWKLVVANDGTRRLFDARVDPGETRDLAASADSVVAALASKLDALVSGESVDELSREAMTPEQRERLKALGYVN